MNRTHPTKWRSTGGIDTEHVDATMDDTQTPQQTRHRAAVLLHLYYCTGESPERDFDDAVAAVAFDDLMTFADHCATREESCRQCHRHWISRYLIKEYARHLGDADLLRERVDGAAGE